MIYNACCATQEWNISKNGSFSRIAVNITKSERKRYITIKMRRDIPILCLGFEVYAISGVVSERRPLEKEERHGLGGGWGRRRGLTMNQNGAVLMSKSQYYYYY